MRQLVLRILNAPLLIRKHRKVPTNPPRGAAQFPVRRPDARRHRGAGARYRHGVEVETLRKREIFYHQEHKVSQRVFDVSFVALRDLRG